MVKWSSIYRILLFEILYDKIKRERDFMNKKGISAKKTVAFCAATALFMASALNCPAVSAAKTNQKIPVKLESLDSTYGKSTLDKLREKLKNKTQSQYKDGDMVSVIVELKEDSLLENYTTAISDVSADKAETFEQYMASAKAKSAVNEIQKEQNSTLSSIEKTADDSNEITVLYKYSTVMNGIAIRVKYGELEKIKQLSNVKAAYVAPVFERPEPVYEKDMSSSSKMIYAQPTWDMNLKGEGQVIAIVDTGLDTHHEAFQQAPSGARITSDMVQSVINKKVLNANVTNADNVYINEKIPYAYDYADSDPVVDPTNESLANGNNHGTHVAGTAAGKSSEITGVAPESQLMIMKVFPDASSGAKTQDIVAALEDAVELGADVINMSLGSTSGFTDGSEDETSLSGVYNRIIQSGVSLSVSAGNSSSFSENNERNSTVLAGNPDTAVIGSPSTYSASTSVASVENNILHSRYFAVNGTNISYGETASADQPMLNQYAGKALEYVVVPNYGEESDYEGIDVNNKAALITRGGITFTEKVKNAAEHGAVAAIVCNNQAGTINMSISNEDYTIPAVSITQADGEVMKADSAKVMEVKSDVGEFDTKQGTQMSDFSSWGVSPNLDLKPEIAAPGGHIYSSVPFNSYSDMSGTSMAAPHIAGTYALVKEYIKSKDEFKMLSDEEIGKLATQLLMSTSDPTKNENGILYAPRQQGSGIVNVYNAVTTKAYLYTDADVEKNGKPKLNLYDDPDKTGKFTEHFHIKNISDESLSYTVKNTSLSETVKDVDGELVLGETPKDVSSQTAMDVTVTGGTYSNGTITVEAGQDAVVTVSFTMNEELKKYYDDNFVNGEFFEGFIQFNGVGADLSIPYLGYYGDWTKAPLFDSGSVYDYKEYSQAPHAALSKEEYLGVNLFDSITAQLIYNAYSPYLYGEYYAQALKPDVNKIAISPNGDGYADSLEYMQIGLLRNARELSYEIKDENNTVIQSGKSEFIEKSAYSDSAAQIIPAYLEVDFTGKDKEGQVLANNSTYTVSVTGKLDYNKHESHNLNDSYSIPVTIDTEEPSVSEVYMTKEDGKNYLVFEAKDNQYLSYIEVGIKENNKLVPIEEQVVNEDTKNAVTEMKVDITEQYEKYGNDAKFYVDAYDYAFNETAFLLSTTDKPTASPSTSPSTSPVEPPVVTPTTEPTVTPTPSPVTKPEKVTGLAVKALTTSSITLTWNGLLDVNGYNVYAYDAEKKSYVKVSTCDAKTNEVKVTRINKKKLKPGTEYSFKVCAYKNVNGKQEVGSDSNILKTATRPLATRLTVKAGTNKAVLSWKKINGVNGYEVYASTNKSSGFKNIKTITNKSLVKYTKTGLKSKKRYYFKVRSYKTVDGKKIYSSFSAVKSAKIK